MRVISTPFRGLVIIEPTLYRDERGYFYESWNRDAFAASGLPVEFVQDNQSGSIRNVVRGLHFQLPPFEQGKLVRAVTGSVLDIAVDLRKGEPTFGRHFGLTLEASSGKMLFIPPGFAHGFRTLEDGTVFAYKCTRQYDAASDRVLLWNDPDLQIDWGITDPLLSEKDRYAPRFNTFDSPF
ncbi:MAG: dTDP-4-dehydrorhamnose 3,5-epimerase [Bacteroidales bacterium]